ncbi:unnamed protein product [Moneuplotes crassus]|uniref:Uncharacterized protein n=1 Tax=Euplotes crassus TaxID=5936 RepID=A0AAD1XM17_EUPCR|nr:unnamed protein product [Moneuplotes crassus]
MLPSFYFVEKRLSLLREKVLFNDINDLYVSLEEEGDGEVLDFTKFKHKFVEKELNLIHFSLSKAECPIDFSDLVSRIVINCWLQKNTPKTISFGVYFLYFFYSLSPLKKRIKYPIAPEVLDVMMDERIVSNDTYAFVLNKMISEGMLSFGIKMPPLDKPFDLNKKEILKKAEYHLDDLKEQYYQICNDPKMVDIDKNAQENVEANRMRLANLIKSEEDNHDMDQEEEKSNLRAPENRKVHLMSSLFK